MKIYVLTQGCYSDYRIMAATTDYEKAKQFSLLHQACLETYDDETVAIRNDPKCKRYHIEVVNGKVTHIYPTHDCEIRCDESSHIGLGTKAVVNPEYHPGNGKQEYVIQEYARGEVYATCEEQARKIFFDMLAEKRAEREGI